MTMEQLMEEADRALVELNRQQRRRDHATRLALIALSALFIVTAAAAALTLIFP